MATNEPVKTDRHKFGEVLRFHREQRALTVRRVADMCCVSVEAIDNFEAGHTVPDGKAWDKYTGMVNKRLRAYAELRQRALGEAATERESIIRSMEHRSMATTNGSNGHTIKATSAPPPPLAHKPFSALVGIAASLAPPPDARTVNPGTYHAAAPPPKIDVDKAVRDVCTAGTGRWERPPGAMYESAISKRKEFVRGILRQRPHAKTGGADGIAALVRQAFGVGLSPDKVDALRAEVAAECRSPNTHQAHEPSIAERHAERPESERPTFTAHPAADTFNRTVTELVRAEATAATDRAVKGAADLEAAVQLIRDAVPGLHTFKLEIDDTGEASVSYTVREVKVVEHSGTFKVKR